MRKLIAILIGVLLVASTFGQTRVNKRIMLDSLQNKVAVSDTSAMLANYALSSEVAEGGAPIGDVQDEIADSLNVLRPTVRLLADTIPIFVFGAGGGNAADTAVFTTSTLYGAFYNGGSDTIVATELRAVMVAGDTPSGTDTLAIQVYWNDTLNVTTGASVTLLNSADLGINSVTTGTSDTSFDNSKIPPNVWVFMRSPGVVTGRKPNMLVATLMGYRIPKY